MTSQYGSRVVSGSSTSTEDLNPPERLQRVQRIRNTSWRSTTSASSWSTQPETNKGERVWPDYTNISPLPQHGVCYDESPHLRKNSGLVNLLNDPEYYTQEKRIARGYKEWFTNIYDRIIQVDGRFVFKAGFAKLVVIDNPREFFDEYVSREVFIKHRNALHDSRMATQRRPATHSSRSSLESNSLSISSDFLTQTEASGALVPIANPSSTAAAITNDDEFQPSRKRLGLRRSITPERKREAMQANIVLDDNYEGDVTSFALRCARTPASENCAVRLENIPVETTYQEFFDSICEGKVFQFSWTEPAPPLHPGRSGRLVFANRLAAEKFISRGDKYSRRPDSGIWFHGVKIIVKWNTKFCPAMRPFELHQSRVLQITGPQEDFDIDNTIKALNDRMDFNLVSSNEWILANGRKVVELVFPSILGQSRQARLYLLNCYKKDGVEHLYDVRYAKDPCEK